MQDDAAADKPIPLVVDAFGNRFQKALILVGGESRAILL
jgi:hypothetical protein